MVDGDLGGSETLREEVALLRKASRFAGPVEGAPEGWVEAGFPEDGEGGRGRDGYENVLGGLGGVSALHGGGGWGGFSVCADDPRPVVFRKCAVLGQRRRYVT